ncbi:PaaX family transcriptional regulator C-terminal domain-containing protein [Herbiconiux sp. 11R-BC]|uniref:PaaX family transcriptional regulator n=1 Tax=Herbiconiux sp. 11R-BC TaxID=3111637 RepID=UPI003BFD9BF9
MTDAEDPKRSAKATRSRTILVGFLGSIVRKMGNWMPIAGVVELMGQCGLDESSVRTAIFRLKQRGWLVPEARARVKGYLLSPVALEALAAGDEIVWHARQPANLDDGWCVVNFSVPESARSQRHKLRSHLAGLGFGNIGSGVWIAPARMLQAATQAIAELDLTEQSAIFVGAHAGGQEMSTLLRTGWDLDEIDRRYRDFLTLHSAQADALEASGVVDGEQAFVQYVTAIDHWRKLPFRDPGLPRAVLPPDWPAPAAGALFERLVAMLEGRALAHAAAFWPQQDAAASAAPAASALAAPAALAG